MITLRPLRDAAKVLPGYRTIDGVTVTCFDRLYASDRRAILVAQETANDNGAPAQVWERDGWFAVCDIASDEIEPSPESQGWTDWALVDPQEAP